MTTNNITVQQLIEASKKGIAKVGDVVTGIVLVKEARRIFVDLGSIGTGVVLGKEYLEALNIIKELKPGDKIIVKIVEAINEDGFWELSLSEADKQIAWQKIRNLKDSRETITTTVLGVNYGGLLLQVEGIEGFLPVSQLSLEHYPRVEGGDKTKILEELRKFTGKEIRVCVLDLDEKEGKLILSEREAQKEDIQRAISQYAVGDIVQGEITGLADFGAFIKFGTDFPLEGLIHISEIDYSIVDDLTQYVKVGDQVKAKIINIKDDRIFLSLKALKENPWARVHEIFEKGKVYTGKVIKLNPLGALIGFKEGIYGIYPIERLNNNLEKLKEILVPGNEYSFVIRDIDNIEKKLILDYATKQK